MAQPYSKVNEIEDELTSEFVHGTDNHCHLVDASAFPSGGGYVRIETTDGAHWCLYEYTAVSTNDLTGLTPCTLGVVETDAAYAFPAGAIVSRVHVAEDDQTVNLPDAELRALAGLTSAAGKVPYFTGAGTADMLDFLDEDPLTSDSATGIPSQQSVKAYVDSYLDVPNIAGGRLTLETSVPISTSDQTEKTIVYYTPFNGDRISLYNGTRWLIYRFAELSIKTTDTQNGTLVNGDATVTGLTSTKGLVAGMEVTGTGIAGGTTILSITDATTLELSANATADGEQSLTFKCPASKLYDVFLWNDAGTLRLEWCAWTNDTTRATALAWQNGVRVKNGATTRRWVGCVRTTGTAGKTEDSGGGDATAQKRFVYNARNQVPRYIRTRNSNTSWTYDTAAWRESNGGTGQTRAEIIVGDSESLTVVLGTYLVQNTTHATASLFRAVGVDSVDGTVQMCALSMKSAANGGYLGLQGGDVYQLSGVGYHYLTIIEYGAGATTTFYGSNSGIARIQVMI